MKWANIVSNFGSQSGRLSTAAMLAIVHDARPQLTNRFALTANGSSRWKLLSGVEALAQKR
jgi:hypothetical protein